MTTRDDNDDRECRRRCCRRHEAGAPAPISKELQLFNAMIVSMVIGAIPLLLVHLGTHILPYSTHDWGRWVQYLIYFGGYVASIFWIMMACRDEKRSK